MNKKKLALVACVMACAMSVGAFTVAGCKKNDNPPAGGEHVHSAEKHASKEATCTEVGYSADYYTCNTPGCEGKYYSDSACTQQINLADITVSVKDHADEDGDNKCDTCKGDMPAKHVHTAGATWESNKVNHWKLCTADDGERMNVGTHADEDENGKCDVCDYQMSTSTPTPEGYTANGTYALDIAGGADKDLFTSTYDKTTDSGYQGTHFKIGGGDSLHVTMKLQKNKVINITGKAIPYNTAKNSSLKLQNGTGTTGAVDSYGEQLSVTGATAVNIDYTLNVTTDGVIVIDIVRGSVSSTGCNITELSVTISDLGPVAVRDITLNKTTGALKVGETDRLTATVTPANADDTGVEWKTSDETVATVDTNGVVTALKKGTVTITATAKGDLTKTATCTYTVSNVAPTGITFDRTSEPTIGIGDNITLTPTVAPANATVKTVVWSASNSNATVDQNGKVTGVTAGEVVITATSTEDPNVKASITVHVVTSIIKVTGVSVSPTSATIDMATSAELQLTATVTPTDATNKYVIWSSSDETIAKVDQTGKVMARKGGNVVITATTEDGGISATCAIECIAPPRVVGTPEITKTSDNEFETAYVEWKMVDGQADWFNVYYVAENDGENWKKLDAPLVRQYADYYRADMVGLKAGNYKMKVVPLTGTVEETDTVAIANGIAVKAHERTGYAFVNGSSSGAYNDDGTLKATANVVYITEANKDTVSLNVTGANANPCVGLQNIINGYKKGKESKPLCVRLIGNITDMATMDKGDIVVDGVTAGVTIEGIGNDATVNGWGIRVKGSSNVEIRNLATMNCDSSEGDNIGLQQDNDHVWVHHCDFFYGHAGSDGDQAKGDGALDTKKSSYVTHSYNHFFDSGKSNLQNMHESGDWRVTYHHNWYDHSDSRHPRIRSATVHVYNNYFDGIAKYGVGATEGSSAFVENNYFRSTSRLRPMLTSMQGTDISIPDEKGNYKGTFSSEDGGSIKSFGNTYDCPADQLKLLVQSTTKNDDAGKGVDCWEASTRDEQVPSSYKAVQGGATYSNFDTASDFYKYNVETAEQARVTVMEYAGRLEGGDFKWTFDNAVDDASYAVDAELKSAIIGYKTSLVKVGE